MLIRYLRLAFTAIALALAGVAFLANPAAAEAVSTATPGGTAVEIDVTLLAFITGSLMPLVTALVTKIDASSAVKATANLVLSVVAGVVSAFVLSNGRLTVYEIGTAAIAAYLAAQTTYSGLWKNIGAINATARLAPEAGIGSGTPPAA